MHVAHSMKYKNDSDMMFENIISMLIDNVRHVIYFDSFLLRMKFMFVSKTHMPFCDVEKQIPGSGCITIGKQQVSTAFLSFARLCDAKVHPR